MPAAAEEGSVPRIVYTQFVNRYLDAVKKTEETAQAEVNSCACACIYTYMPLLIYACMHAIRVCVCVHTRTHVYFCVHALLHLCALKQTAPDKRHSLGD